MRLRPAFVILTVLVVVVMAVLAASTVVLRADARVAGFAGAQDREQSRLLAWSGLRAALAELTAQRDTILQGIEPELTASGVVYEDDAGRRGVVRLVEARAGGRAEPLAGRLDLNHATAEMLGALPGITPALAQRIVATRDAAPFQSVVELLDVEGVDDELLYGPGVEGDAGAGLVDHLAVHAFEPEVQSGVASESQRGRRRGVVGLEWSDELRNRLTRRYDEELAGALELVLTADPRPETRGAVVGLLAGAGLGPRTWGAVLDLLALTEDLYAPARVDLLTAPEAVLAAVPGLDAESASAIVSARERLGDEDRVNVAWPVEQGVVEASAFEQAVDWLTTRSLQYRVVVEAGVLDPVGADEPAAVARDQLLGLADDGDALAGRVLLEGVIDVGSVEPRIAYVRDVTWLEVVRSTGGADGEDAPAFDAAAEAEEAPEAPVDAGRPGDEMPEEPEPDDAAAGPGDETGDPSGGERAPRDPRVGRWRAVGGA